MKKALLEKYINDIYEKCEMPVKNKKQNKVSDEYLEIPTINSYTKLIYNNYNINQLKSFAKNYKIKVSGNKQELLKRIYCFLYLSSYIVKIQKIFRKHLVQKYKKLRGPAIMNRKLCTNNEDFVSMDPVEEINFHQFISYKDKDGFIYGFDIVSLHNLFIKTDAEIKNPYNRNIIPMSVFKNIRNLIRISKLINITINLELQDESQHISFQKAIELKAVSLFQNIDSLGNYSNPNWFLELNKFQLIRFLDELIDVWDSRAQLTSHIRNKICPHGDPFGSIDSIEEMELLDLQKYTLTIIEKITNTGINNEYKTLGSFYVLGCLTLVSLPAARSLPWLTDSFNTDIPFVS
jgi:hypothetical protein